MSKTPLVFFSFVSEDVLKFSFEKEGNQQCLAPLLLSVGDFRRHMELRGLEGGRRASSRVGLVPWAAGSPTLHPSRRPGHEKAQLGGPGVSDLCASLPFLWPAIRGSCVQTRSSNITEIRVGKT